MDVICFLANVRQCNISYSVVNVQLCFYIFEMYYDISFLPARVASNL